MAAKYFIQLFRIFGGQRKAGSDLQTVILLCKTTVRVAHPEIKNRRDPLCKHGTLPVLFSFTRQTVILLRKMTVRVAHPEMTRSLDPSC